MSGNIPVEKNKEYRLQITGITAEGAGVGKIDGFAVFVAGAVLWEEVEVRIIKITAGYAFGKLLRVLTASPYRQEADCPYAKRCGGCVFRHVTYEGQLLLKHKIVEDAIRRLGGAAGAEIQPVLPSPATERYRNKSAFPCGRAENGIVFGFFAPRSHTLIPLEDCLLESKKSIECMQAIRAWAERYRIPAYDEKTGRGVLRHVVMRETSSGKIMCTVVASGQPQRVKELKEYLNGTDSLYWNINSRNTNVIFGDTFIHIAGEAYITETILQNRFRVSPPTFLQVNHAQTERLYSLALDLLQPQKTETALDLYCGMGSITLTLAQAVKSVVGIECVPEAIEDAKVNARENGITNTSFLCGNAEDILPDYCKTHSPDIMVMDPPRKGCDPLVLSAIRSTGIRRLVYISCNPATLARDLKLLCADDRFTLQTIQPVDMFPHTGHVETVCLLTKNK